MSAGTEPRRRISGAWWLVFALVLAGAFWWASSLPWHAASKSHHVVYQVSGSAGNSGVVTYATPGGQEQVSGAALPWASSLDVRGAGAALFVSAQNSAASGTVSCSISVDGETVASHTSSGAYVVVSCSAPLP